MRIPLDVLKTHCDNQPHVQFGWLPKLALFPVGGHVVSVGEGIRRYTLGRRRPANSLLSDEHASGI